MMISKLFMLTGAGLVLGVVCLAGTAVLVRNDLKGDGITVSERADGDGMRIVRYEKVDPQPVISRTLDVKLGDSLGIDLPADVTYIQGQRPEFVATGSKDLVERLRFEDGRLFLASGPHSEKAFRLKLVGNHMQSTPLGGHLKVRITASSVKRIDLSGAGDLDIRDYDQPELSLRLSGAGNVKASGRTQAVSLDISGAGNADLEDLKAVDADVRVSGLGNADINATGTVKANISGAGNISLTQAPARLDKQISGLGRIDSE